MTRVAAAAHRREFAPAGYLSIVAAVAALQILALIGFGSTDFYVTRSAYPLEAMSEQKFTIRGQAADVVFVGDSAVGMGIQPEVITGETGLTAINLGIPVNAYANEPELLIDHYLANNAPPRVIVLYVTPSIPVDEFTGGWYEAAEELLRHGSAAQLGDFFLKHPERIVEFAHMVANLTVHSSWSDENYRRVVALQEASGGFLSFEDLPWAIPEVKRLSEEGTFCDVAMRRRPANRSFIEHFRQKYTTKRTTVLVFTAPLAECDRSINYYAAEYDAIADNAMHSLPAALFVQDAARVHLTKQGAALNSRILAAWLQDIAWSRGILTPGAGAAGSSD